jgi:hypothetical protein
MAYTPTSRFFEAGTAFNRLLTEAPYLPRCSEDKTAARTLPRDYAIRWPYMQINRQGFVSWLIFDLDHENAWAWEDAGLPAPNFIVRNRTNGHSHLYYAIVPVCTTENARSHPIFYMRAVYAAFAARLDSDQAYSSGPVAKTPGHPWWQTTELHNRVHELGELADYVELDAVSWRKSPDLESVSHSRHCTLFEKLRFYAYSIVNEMRAARSYERFFSRLEAFAHNSNHFHKFRTAQNLPLSSVRATVRSVARWTWAKYKGGGKCHRGAMELDKSLPLQTRQRLAAKRTHEVRHKATESKIRAACASLRAQGKRLTQAAIALIAGITRQTVAAHPHVVKEAPTGASVTNIRDVKHGVHQITAPQGPAFDLCFSSNNQPSKVSDMRDRYEMVKISSGAAMEAPRVVHLDKEGISAYSCLIPYDHEHARRVHFVSGADGAEYGQFPDKEQAVAQAERVLKGLGDRTS